ncbi:hypothetical protein CVO96_04165 [Deinococcus koreensis]|uniref:Uncharacterized protein n=1 Tax=Deinococcus koreensis TaxID=2054903 RepID=A0A2K3UVU6_9DEIO|nr:hypothetical protein CVO96_04165 [Deinococcus koreensis]
MIPATFTFAIWGPIYLGSLAYATYQAWPGQGARPLHRQVGPWAALAFGASALWALAAGFPPPLLSWGTVAMIFALFGSLLVALLRAVALAETPRDRLLVVAPLGLYAGYITLATVANTAATLYQLGIRTPLGLSEPAWAALMLGAAGVLAGVVIRHLGVNRHRAPLTYPAAVVWGLGGVAAQNLTVLNLAAQPQPVVAAAAGLAALLVAGTAWRRRRAGAR